MEWRRKHKMDTIVEDYETPEVLAKFGVGGICGVDKDGFPVWIDCFGRFDIKGKVFPSQESHNLINVCILKPMCQSVYYLAIDMDSIIMKLVVIF